MQNAVLVEGELIIGTPKTCTGRSVPSPAFLQVLLAEVVSGLGAVGLVFADERGHPLVTPNTRENSWFDGAPAVVGLSPMTIDDLRHTAASLAVSSGANVKAVQKMIGHASAAMTLDVYADLFDGDLDSVATRFDHAAVSTDVVGMWSNADRPGAAAAPSRSKTPEIRASSGGGT